MSRKNQTRSLRISYAQAVHDEKEEERVLKVLREHRTMMGREVEEFERRVAKVFFKKYGIMVNSGSSANLLVWELLNLPKGSEVITPLLTFSTTIAPLIQKGLVPIFVDVVQGKFFIDVDKIEKAVSKKTKALMIPMLMGNVPDVERLRDIANRYNLFFIEDSCDAIVGLYKRKPTGAYSDISTTSFYGSHVITAGGGGGMILVNREDFRDRAKVLRGWGRTSSIFAESEKLEERFGRELDGTPYDGKFIFDEIGYNFLPLELGAAFGNAQLDKLKKFVRLRKKNFKILQKFFSNYPQFFIVPLEGENAEAQWLAFPLTIKKGAPFTRLEFVIYLEKNNVQTRPIFTGNILKQPGFKNITHRLIEKEYPVTNYIMEQGVIVGLHQGLTLEHLDRLKEVVISFLKQYP